MRAAAVAGVVLLCLTAACGQDAEAPTGQPAPATAQAPSTAQQADDVAVLTAVVGEPGNPDAFTLALTDASGAEVSALPAGDYQIRVADLSEIHNFHLTGQGVDRTTTVPETGEAVWDVTFAPGDYSYRCDPHPSMRGGFTVA